MFSEKSFSPQSKFTGWKNEVQKYSKKMQSFIAESFTISGTKYDSLTELHISGDNSSILMEVVNGDILPNDVNIYYKDDIPESIHCRYDNQKKGHDIDLYIKGKALDDFLTIWCSDKNISENHNLTEKYLGKYEVDNEGFVKISDISRELLNRQTQYISRFIDGTDSSYPNLGKLYKIKNVFRNEKATGNYYDYKIHKDDVEEFIKKVKEYYKE